MTLSPRDGRKASVEGYFPSVEPDQEDKMANLYDRHTRHAFTDTQRMIKTILEPVWGLISGHLFHHDNVRPDGGYFTSYVKIHSYDLNFKDDNVQLAVGINDEGKIDVSLIGTIDHKQDGDTDPANIWAWRFHLSDPECLEKVKDILIKVVKGERP